MSQVAAELTAIIEGLSDERAKALLDYARYLAEKQDDEEWERVVERATRSPKFAAYMAEVEQEIREGRTEPIEVGYRRYRRWARDQTRSQATDV